MLSKSFEKYVNSLKQKKYRTEYQHFIAEGKKLAEELLNSRFIIEKILAYPFWISAHETLLHGKNKIVEEVNEREMQKISGLVNASEVLMVIEIPSDVPD